MSSDLKSTPDKKKIPTALRLGAAVFFLLSPTLTSCDSKETISQEDIKKILSKDSSKPIATIFKQIENGLDQCVVTPNSEDGETVYLNVTCEESYEKVKSFLDKEGGLIKSNDDINEGSAKINGSSFIIKQISRRRNITYTTITKE